MQTKLNKPHKRRVTMTYLTLEQKVAAKCCAIILSIDSNRGNEKEAAEFIAKEYKIDLDKLRAGEYDV